jgi:hypothetical protein
MNANSEFRYVVNTYVFWQRIRNYSTSSIKYSSYRKMLQIKIVSCTES